MSTYIPRDYQDEAVNCLWGALTERRDCHPLIILPTGTGKAPLIGQIARDAIKSYRLTGKIIVLTHVQELIEQDEEAIRFVWPAAPTSIYSAGLGEKSLLGRIVVAGIQSFINVCHLVTKPDMLIIDEAHMIPLEDETLYRKCIATLRQANPKMVVIGLTATAFRAKGGSLLNQGLFNFVAYDASQADRFVRFIKEGYLVPLVAKATETYIDMDGVSTVGGDYNQKQMQEVVDKESLTRACLAEVMRKAGNRKKWLVFAAGVDHAIHVAQMLNEEFGVPAGVVHSKLKGKVYHNGVMMKARDAELAKFAKGGPYRAMVNNGILTTGYNHKGIDLIVVLRPTKSNSLWIQMLGRGTRPDYEIGYDLTTIDGRLEAIAQSDKQDCLVMDFAYNTARLGPINEPILPEPKKKGGGQMVMKTCPLCNHFNWPRAARCTGESIHTEDGQCPHLFPPPSLAIDQVASTDQLISDSTPIVEEMDVKLATYSLYKRAGKPASIKAFFHVGLVSYVKWLNIEHSGSAKANANRWWWDNVGNDSVPPDTCEEFIARQSELRTPVKIKVWLKTGKNAYPDILEFKYPEKETVDV